jgi:acetylornithine/succinyldiaminopimelate/putrescine aminotransferase
MYRSAVELVSGKGSRVTDASRRSYLDFFGGIRTSMLGYDVAEVCVTPAASCRTPPRCT